MFKFKKSLAVLTTAAILASTTSIVAYAEAEAGKIKFGEHITAKVGSTTLSSTVNIAYSSDESNVVNGAVIEFEVDTGYELQKNGATFSETSYTVDASTDSTAGLEFTAVAKQITVTKGDNVTAIKAGDTDITSTLKAVVGDKITATVADGYKAQVNNEDIPTGGYTVLGTEATIAVTAVSASSGETPATGDAVVWAYGKDVKANARKDEEGQQLASYTITYAGMYSGGKWNVAVVDGSIGDSLGDFLDAIDEGKGKLKKDPASDGKKVATAKLSNGSIVVKAAKVTEETTAFVWLYETKKASKTEVEDYLSATSEGKTGVVNGEVMTGATVVPVCFPVTIKVADSKPGVYDEDGKEIKTAELGDGDTLEVSIATKASGVTVSDDVTYTETAKNGKVKVTVNGNGYFTITGSGDADTITFTCVESRKTAKLSIKKPKNSSSSSTATEQTITVPDNVKVYTVKTNGAKDKEITTKKAKKNDVIYIELPDGGAFGDGVDQYKVEGATAVAGKANNYKVTGDVTVTKVEGFTITIVGSNEGSLATGETVKIGGTDVTSGNKYVKDSVVTLTVPDGKTVEVKAGDADVTLSTEKTFTLTANVTVTFKTAS